MIWPDIKSIFTLNLISGIIDNYESSKGYHVQYDDGDEEWIEELTDIVRFDDVGAYILYTVYLELFC